MAWVSLRLFNNTFDLSNCVSSRCLETGSSHLRFPGQFNFCGVDIGALHLSVGALGSSAVGVMPGTGSLRFVSVEVSFEISSVRVDPLAFDELALIELANVFFTSLEDDVGSFSVFLSLGPLA